MAELSVQSSIDLDDFPSSVPTVGQFHVANSSGVFEYQDVSSFDASGVASNLATHIADHANPHAVTVNQIGALAVTNNLGDVSSGTLARANLSVYSISTMTGLLADKAPLASPALTGTPTAPTVIDSADSSTKLATTGFVQAVKSDLLNGAGAAYDTLKELQDLIVADETTASALATTVGGKLAKSSNLSDLTNAVTARTNLGLGNAATQTISTFVLTILDDIDAAAVRTTIGAGTSSFNGAFSGLSAIPTTLSGYGITDAAPIASPTFTGTPAAPTPTAGDNSTKLATTAFVETRIGILTAGASTAFDTFIELSNQMATDESGVTALTTTVGGKLAKASNLSDLTDASVARTNLGLGTAATQSSTAFQASDATLTALSGKTITAFAYTFLDDVDAATVRATLGAGTSSFSGVFSGLSGIPTTLSGYGITNAVDLTTDQTIAGTKTLTSSPIVPGPLATLSAMSFGGM